MKMNDAYAPVHRLDLALSVTADPSAKIVLVRAQKGLTPAEARKAAVELLYAADAAEGIRDMSFGYDDTDSRELAILRQAVAQALGWEDDEQELEQDFEARVHQIGAQLRKERRHLAVVKA